MKAFKSEYWTEQEWIEFWESHTDGYVLLQDFKTALRMKWRKLILINGVG